MLNVNSAHGDDKTQKMLERLSGTVHGLSAKLVWSNLRVKHLSESLHEEEGRKKKRRKVVDELRASGTSETLFMSPSKIQKTRDIASSRELEKQQLQHEKRVRAEARAQEKTQEEAEAQSKRDERTAAALVRKTAAAQKKAAAQKLREATKAQKQTGNESKTNGGRRQGRPKIQSAAQKLEDIMREPVAVEPVERATTAKGRPVRRPA